MFKIISAAPITGYKLDIRFDDGVGGVVDLKARLFGPVFEALKDPALFAQVGVDEFGAVCWPNGADLAPDALHEQLKNGAQAA
jgi:hypothetical protein